MAGKPNGGIPLLPSRKEARCDIHGSVQHPDKDHPIVDGTIKEDESMNIPASEVRREFRARAAHQIVARKHLKSFIEKPDDHRGVLRAALSDVVFDGDVVFAALPGSKDAGHELKPCWRRGARRHWL